MMILSRRHTQDVIATTACLGLCFLPAFAKADPIPVATTEITLLLEINFGLALCTKMLKDFL